MTKALLFISILLLGLAACQSSQATPTPTVDPDIDLDELPEAQASAAASGQAPNAQSGSGDLCSNPYIPSVEGATWTYTLHTDSGDITQVDTVTDVGDGAFLVETVQPDLSYVITWHCTAEGLLWLQSDGGIFSAVFQTASGTSTVETLSYSGISLPRTVQPGDTWTASEQIHVSGNGVDETFNLTAELRAVGVESITVPAGTFDALRIDLVLSNDSETMSVVVEESDWYVAGIGHIKSTGLINSSISYDLELVSYSIP